MTADRNRTTVRRGLRAGAVGAVLAVAVLLVLVATADVPGSTVIAGGIAAFGLVSSTWLLVAALLDVWAGQPPDLRRTLWTIGVTLLAMIGPFLLLGSVFQAATSGAP